MHPRTCGRGGSNRLIVKGEAGPSDVECAKEGLSVAIALGDPTGETMPLSRAPVGVCCRIRRHFGSGAVRCRLLGLGFIPNATVEVVRVATLGDPMEVKVGDYYVALRKGEARNIEVATV